MVGMAVWVGPVEFPQVEKVGVGTAVAMEVEGTWEEVGAGI